MGNKDDIILSSDEYLEDDMVDDLNDLVGTTMHLVLDDETEMEAVIIASFMVESYPWDYIALLPLVEEEEEEDTDVILYRLQVDEEGSPILGMMESEEEYQAVADQFYKELERLEEES